MGQAHQHIQLKHLGVCILPAARITNKDPDPVEELLQLGLAVLFQKSRDASVMDVSAAVFDLLQVPLAERGWQP